jgi:hypothetical protein
MICSGNMVYYFSKVFATDGLGSVDYYRCIECGFCASKTHFEMSESEWIRLNTSWHDANNLRTDNPFNRNQRHFNQALMLHLLSRQKIIEPGKWLDYASGQGGLSSKLYAHFGAVLHSYDKFIKPASFPVPDSELIKSGYSLVTNTAMFEHVRHRATLDEIESYVGDTGALGIFTFVCGTIPADPEWNYLLPVHCAFFTNKSMSLLMQQWGYTCSIYSEVALLWIWFKTAPELIAEKVAKLNRAMGWEYLHFKAGFMDFWP